MTLRRSTPTAPHTRGTERHRSASRPGPATNVPVALPPVAVRALRVGRVVLRSADNARSVAEGTRRRCAALKHEGARRPPGTPALPHHPRRASRHGRAPRARPSVRTGPREARPVTPRPVPGCVRANSPIPRPGPRRAPRASSPSLTSIRPDGPPGIGRSPAGQPGALARQRPDPRKLTALLTTRARRGPCGGRPNPLPW
jgi:hypothetical protein